MNLVFCDVENLTESFKKDSVVIAKKDKIHNCIGCFGCWIKTPGQCVIKDDYSNIGELLSKCDELIIISKMTYGSVSPFIKNLMDRAISYIHPYFEKRNGEMHHKRRYENVISITAYFYGNASENEKETAKNIITANAVNYDGKVKDVIFLNSIDELGGITL